MVDNPAQIENVLNNVVYALFAQSGQEGGAAREIGNLVVFAHPDAVDQIVKAPAVFRKNFSLISALGFSRFNTNDEDWAARRAITQDRYLAAAKPSREQGVSAVYSARLADCDASVPGIQQALFAASLGIFYEALGLVP
jgi:hypothetical protein